MLKIKIEKSDLVTGFNEIEIEDPNGKVIESHYGILTEENDFFQTNEEGILKWKHDWKFSYTNYYLKKWKTKLSKKQLDFIIFIKNECNRKDIVPVFRVLFKSPKSPLISHPEVKNYKEFEEFFKGSISPGQIFTLCGYMYSKKPDGRVATTNRRHEDIVSV